MGTEQTNFSYISLFRTMIIRLIKTRTQPTLSVSPAPTKPQLPAWTRQPTYSFCVSTRIAYLLYSNHFQASNHKTSLANYFPFTLGNLRHLSNGYLSMQHLSWRHLSISAISQLLLARF